MWFHVGCVDFPTNLYSAMAKFVEAKGEGLYWFCGPCNSDYKSIRGDIQELKDKMKHLEEGWKGVKEDMAKSEEAAKGLKEEMVAAKKAVEVAAGEGVELVKREIGQAKSSFAEAVKTEGIKFVDIVKEEEDKWVTVAGKDKKKTDRTMQMEVAEALEREKRKDKIVVIGIEEETEGGPSDGETVTDILDSLVTEYEVGFTVIGRIGKKVENGRRPIRVMIEDQESRRRILGRAKMLKGWNDTKKIYVVPDMTRMEQERDKVLRDEVKRRKDAGEMNVKIVKKVVVSGRGSGSRAEECE
jgi:hypothetical protein